MSKTEARKLHAGDEVTWSDPDGGTCSDTFVIRSITEHGGGIFRIRKDDGSELEVFNHELS